MTRFDPVIRRVLPMILLALVGLACPSGLGADEWIPIPFPEEEPSREETPAPSPTPAGEPTTTPPVPATVERDTKIFGRWQVRAFLDREEDRVVEDRAYGGSRLDLGAEARVSRSILARVSGRLDWRYHEHQDRTLADTELREAYLQLRFPRLDLRFGQQFYRWGRMDSLSPVDRLNPLDLREPVDIIQGRREDAKIPVLGLRGDAYLGPIQVQAVWLPLFEPARYDLVGSNWALLRLPGSDLALDLDLPNPMDRFNGFTRLEDLLLDGDAEMVNGWNRLFTATEYPEDDGLHGDWGGRIGWTNRWFELHLSYLYAYLDQPTVYLPAEVAEWLRDGVIDSDEFLALTVDGWLEQVEAVFERVPTFGAELAFQVGRLGVSLEAGYSLNHPLYTAAWAVEKRDRLLGSEAVTYELGDGTHLGLEAHQVMVVENPTNSTLDPVENLLTGLVRRGFLQDRLELELRAILDTTGGGAMLAPEIRFRPWRRLQLDLGYHLFDGEEGTFFGPFDRGDQAYSRLTLRL